VDEVDVILFMPVEDEGEILRESGGDEVCGACVGMGWLGGAGEASEICDLVVVIVLFVNDDASSAAFLGWGGGCDGFSKERFIMLIKPNGWKGKKIPVRQGRVGGLASARGSNTSELTTPRGHQC
jgi:hypothetical protein